jgi:replication factor C large subunit
LAPKDIAQLLEGIAKQENITCEEKALTAIAHRAGGDARAAVNDLQTLSDGNTLTMAEIEALGDREQKEAIEQALLRVFKTTNATVALPAFDNVDVDVDQLFLLDRPETCRTSIPNLKILRAQWMHSQKQTSSSGEIRRWQYYRFYVYIYNLLSAGIALAKTEKYPGMPTFKRSSRPLQIWMANQRNAKRKAIAQKLAEKTHTSAKRSFNEILILKGVFKKGKQQELIEELELTEDEVAWLRG